MQSKKIPDEQHWYGQEPVAMLLIKKVKKDACILEMGIGKGGVVKRLLRKQPNLNIVGFDIKANSLKIARSFFKKNCKGKYTIFKSSQDINLVTKFGKNKFDFVISAGVLDYAKEPDNVIKNVKKILKSGGYFAFTLFDNFSSSDYDGKSPRQRYISKSGIKTWGYRETYIKKLLKKINLRLCSISLFKGLHKCKLSELSHSEIQAVKENRDSHYEDHFVILARKN